MKQTAAAKAFWRNLQDSTIFDWDGHPSLIEQIRKRIPIEGRGVVLGGRKARLAEELTTSDRTFLSLDLKTWRNQVVPTVACDLEEPYPAEVVSFSPRFAIAAFVLEYIGLETTLRNLAEVLPPNGRLVCVTHDLNSEIVKYLIKRAAWDYGLEYAISPLEENLAQPYWETHVRAVGFGLQERETYRHNGVVAGISTYEKI